MARKRKYQTGMDTGTAEMARQFTVVPKLASPTQMTMKVLDGSEVDALLMKDIISPAEHGTLMSLANKLMACGFSALRSPDYSSPIFSDPSAVGDKRAASVRGSVHLIEKMDKHPDIGTYRRKQLINLCIQDAPWSGEVAELKTCIRALDDVFMRRR